MKEISRKEGKKYHENKKKFQLAVCDCVTSGCIFGRLDLDTIDRSSPPLLPKGVLKNWSKYTGKHYTPNCDSIKVAKQLY